MLNESNIVNKSYGPGPGNTSQPLEDSILKFTSYKQPLLSQKGKSLKRTSTELQGLPLSPSKSILKVGESFRASSVMKQDKKVTFFPKKTVFYIPKRSPSKKNASSNSF
jgi:hypothetical protein